MTRKSEPPSVDKVAFDCPHCGAYTTHTWFDLYARALSDEQRVPGLITADVVESVRNTERVPEERKDGIIAYLDKLARGFVVVDKTEPKYVYNEAGNLHLSKCFNCQEISVFVHGRVLFPNVASGPAPNPDIPNSVREDYIEASRVLTVSPRGAAALLRLAIQKLCAELGGKGRNIDDDIAEMVKNGLSPVVQQALDSVRVIGNEAVHPGTLDLRDDFDIASKLFDLVNIIAETMISNPKHVEGLYSKLPEEKRKAIDKRDGRSPKKERPKE